MKELAQSRSAKRLRKQLVAAIEKRERLLQEPFSLESELGKLVIVVSSAADLKSQTPPDKQYATFIDEAERLKAERGSRHAAVEIKPKAFPMDISFDLADRDVSDLIFIGHGSISNFWTDGQRRNYDWRDVSKGASHLKTGVIEQRICGHLPEEVKLHVPLGTFALANLENLYAAPGKQLPDDQDPGDAVMERVYSNHIPLLDQIQHLNEALYAEPPEIVTG